MVDNEIDYNITIHELMLLPFCVRAEPGRYNDGRDYPPSVW